MPYDYSIPERTNDGWQVGNLTGAGMDLRLLAQLVAEIQGQAFSNLHSVLIVKDGRLVFEEYFSGEDEYRGQPLGTVQFDRTTLHDLRSVTKSVTSALVGIAVGQGALKVSDPMLSFFPDQLSLATPDKRTITLHHLLTMTSGLEWDERTYPYTDPRNSETAMDLSESSVAYVLGQEVVAEPGTRFQYCGGCTMLLAGVVNAATGTHLDAFAEEHLFTPLGITEFEWLHHQDGLPIAASGLRLRPRDLAKFGYLFVNEGRWNGRQVLPASWVRESTREQVRLDSISAYGYQWWVDLEPLRAEVVAFPVARGNGGQRIYVVPSLGLVAVITAGNYNSAATRFSEQAFWRFVLPAAARVEN
jgi:CubicO group peptidase (beta-lactamase class C family)